MCDLSHLDFLRTLEPWVAFSERYWWDDPARPDLGCCGSGYDNWGVQTNQKYAGAMAVLAADPDLDESASGLAREQILNRALRALRFSIASHVSGDHQCSDGTRWGHTWISALGVERMMHGIEAIDQHLTDGDRAGLRRMIVSEADALLELPITATKWNSEGGNRPEANTWNGATLWRAACMFPDEPHADDWREKSTRFSLNAISVPGDADDDAIFEGRPLREWHVGPNFFESYALDHHGYLNIAYMLTCLSNTAMMHFACLSHGWEPSPGLYHHGRELWALVRRLLFDDGRLCRIGGDSRQRYSRAQDYLLPVLLLAAQHFGDDHAPRLEAEALKRIRFEQQFCGDGSFFSRRLKTIAAINPYYYSRIESDRIMGLGMNACWRRTLEIPSAISGADYEGTVAGAWGDSEHGAMMHRSRRRIASWSWRARTRPQGLCLPPDAGDFAEWDRNMAGTVVMLDANAAPELLEHAQAKFEGGFVTWGAMDDAAGARLAEGWTMPEPLIHRYAVAALPDDRTMIVLQRCVSPIRCWLSELKGLKLNLPNDIFNGGRRRYEVADGALELSGRGTGTTDLNSRWVCVDGRIGAVGIYGAESFAVYQAGRRRAAEYGDSLFYDELCFPCKVETTCADPGEVLLDCGTAVLSGADAAETASAAAGAERLQCAHEEVRMVQIIGADALRYVLTANFGDSSATVTVAADSLSDVVTGDLLDVADGSAAVRLPAGEARLLRLS